MASHFSLSASGFRTTVNSFGVLEVSVLPINFFKFFAALAYTRGLQYALVRQDGLFAGALSRSAGRLGQPAGFTNGFPPDRRAIPGGGDHNSTSPIDGVDRRYAIRRLEAETPVPHGRD